MLRLQAYLFELKPTGEQQRQMRRFAGACRFVFNKALALQKDRYQRGEKKMGYAGLCKELTAWKSQPETLWLNESPSQTLQQALKNLEEAYKNFFEKRADFPEFKKKGVYDKFRYPQGFKIDQANRRVLLPKLGWMRVRYSREVLGTPKNITISQSSGKWYASIQTEREVEQPIPRSSSAVGIDVGIARFATLSDGSHIESLNSFKRHQDRLRRAQQSLSRKTKFSNNWKKAKAKVQKIHSRISHVRQDFLHKTTTTISKKHAMVCVEDLQVRNMSKSAAGSIAAPGRNVKAKSGLNKAILDQGWSEFRRQLDYKLVWAGGWLIAVPPHNTSRTCPCCGHVSADNRQTQARFACMECGFVENADLVGAINVLNRGMKMLEGQDTADASAGCASTARIACEVSGAARPTAAGTHRSDSGITPCHP